VSAQAPSALDSLDDEAGMAALFLPTGLGSLNKYSRLGCLRPPWLGWQRGGGHMCLSSDSTRHKRMRG
jgi:hypothetical protein